MGFKAKKCIRYNDPWHAHALTFSCFHRQPLLESDWVKDVFVASLQAARVRHQFDIWAYVVMPDHVHLVVWPRLESYSISSVLHSIKRPTAYRARKSGLDFGRRFWQAGGGYDRNLFKPRTVRKEIDYIHANPVRRGLCDEPKGWRYSSAGFWAGHSDVPLIMDDSLPARDAPSDG